MSFYELVVRCLHCHLTTAENTVCAVLMQLNVDMYSLMFRAPGEAAPSEADDKLSEKERQLTEKNEEVLSCCVNCVLNCCV